MKTKVDMENVLKDLYYTLSQIDSIIEISPKFYPLKMAKVSEKYKLLIRQFRSLKETTHMKESDFFFPRPICYRSNIIHSYVCWKPKAELFIEKWKYQKI